MEIVTRLLKSGTFWTIAGVIVALAGLLFSSYQFYAAAELSKRTLVGGLVLDAHKQHYDFIARVTQHYSANRDEDGKLKAKPGDPIHPEIRLALIRSDGAIARAQIIEQPDIQACLMKMFRISSEILEVAIAQGKDIDLRSYALDLDDFPDMVRRYISGLPMNKYQKARDIGHGDLACDFLARPDF